MTFNRSALCLLSLALATAGSAQTVSSSNGGDTHYTKAQLKRMAADAHTPSQYEALAAYYGKRQTDFMAQAAEEKQEWARRSAHVVLTAAKYPRPVDSAHYLYDYYTNEAAEAGQLAAKYNQLAAPAAPITGK